MAEDLAAALARIRFEPFELALDGVGRFEQHRRGALWAGVAAEGPPLKALAAKVERACQSVGLEPERRAYPPAHHARASTTSRASTSRSRARA